MKGLAIADIERITAKLKPCKDFFMVIHPRTHYILKVLSARFEYKHQQWIKRWEKWSGKKYVEVEGELGYFG